jgi:hypothetical protein
MHTISFFVYQAANRFIGKWILINDLFNHIFSYFLEFSVNVHGIPLTYQQIIQSGFFHLYGSYPNALSNTKSYELPVIPYKMIW